MLPSRQQVAELPDINWKEYMESVEKIVRQHSAVYQRTRRKGVATKEAAALALTKTVSLSISVHNNNSVIAVCVRVLLGGWCQR